MKKILFCFIISMLFPANIKATAQFGEVIFMNGKKYTMFSCPLETNEELTKALKAAYPIEKISNTALWRGYIGYWSIKDESLYLDSLKYFSEISNNNSNRLTDRMATIIPDKEGVFGKYMDENGVRASWFSGELRIIEGKQVRYVHMGYESTYEKETFITVKEGAIGEKRQVKNKTVYENKIQTFRGSKALNDAFVKKFPDQEGYVYVQFSYSDFDSKGKPHDVNVEVISKEPIKNEEAIRKFIRSYILKKHILGLYKNEGKLISEKWTMRLGSRIRM